MHQQANASLTEAKAKASAVAPTQSDFGCRMQVQLALPDSEAMKIECDSTSPIKFLLTFASEVLSS
jgi:hypothetical protein